MYQYLFNTRELNMYPTNNIHTKDEAYLRGFDRDTSEVPYKGPVTMPVSTKLPKQIDWFQMKNFAFSMSPKAYTLLEHIVTKELNSLGQLNKSLMVVCLEQGYNYSKMAEQFRRFKLDNRMYPVFLKLPYKDR